VRINDTPGQPITPVCITRAAAQVEKLRERMDAFVTRTGKRPRAFLCNMGSLRDYKARSDFSRGFLAVGGYEVVFPAALKTPADAAEAYAKSGAKLAVICSTDDNYPALVPPLVEAIRARNPEAIVVLAGFPADQLEAHKKSGVNEFIHIRADAVALLSKFHTQHGIE
jgi:methylmalonyl-CoA mutase